MGQETTKPVNKEALIKAAKQGDRAKVDKELEPLGIKRFGKEGWDYYRIIIVSALLSGKDELAFSYLRCYNDRDNILSFIDSLIRLSVSTNEDVPENEKRDDYQRIKDALRLRHHATHRWNESLDASRKKLNSFCFQIALRVVRQIDPVDWIGYYHLIHAIEHGERAFLSDDFRIDYRRDIEEIIVDRAILYLKETSLSLRLNYKGRRREQLNKEDFLIIRKNPKRSLKRLYQNEVEGANIPLDSA